MTLKFKKAIILSAVLFLTLISFQSLVQAVPAAPGEQEMVQPNGAKFKATLHGDEWLNWATTNRDEVLTKGDDGYWYYGQIASDKLVPSRAKYKINPKPRQIVTQQRLLNLTKKNPNIYKPYDSQFKSPSTGPAPAPGSRGTVKQQKLLVLLVNFTNVSIQNTDADWSDRFFGASGRTVNAYYNEVSNGSFQFVPAEETAGTANDGVIRVSLNYAHPNFGNFYDTAGQNLAKNALSAADAYIDFSTFDTNGDGYISSDELCVAIVAAGGESSSGSPSPSIWAHNWSLSSANAVVLDGKSVCARNYGSYIEMGEIHGSQTTSHMATIGIPCHELGHCLGLSDLYDTSGNSDGIGIHSLMAGGIWLLGNGTFQGDCPSNLDAWCKVRLGFVNPVTISSSGTYTLNAVAIGNYNVYKIPTSNPDQYFLLENRQFSNFDTGLASKCKNTGIAVWHIDEGVIRSGDMNNNVNHKGVDLEEANEGILGYSQLDTKTINFNIGSNQYSGYSHYYSLGESQTYRHANVFSVDTAPGSSLYDGSSTGFTVTVPGTGANAMDVDISLTSPNPVLSEISANSQFYFTGTNSVYIGYSLTRAMNVTVSILDNSGNPVKVVLDNVAQNAGQQNVSWDGRNTGGSIVPQGSYKIKVDAVDPSNVNEAPRRRIKALEIGVSIPEITNVSDSPDPVDSQGARTSTINYTLSEDAHVTVLIYNSSNTRVRNLADSSVTAGQSTAVWDCKDDTGTNVPDGTYTYYINAVNAFGGTANQVSGTITIQTVTVPKPEITNVSDSPDPVDSQGTRTSTIGYTLSENAHVTIVIYNSSNTRIRGLVDADVTAGQNTAVWDCKNDTGTNVPDGVYTYKINAVNATGGTANEASGTITIQTATVSTPEITAVSDSPDPVDANGARINTIKYTLSENAHVTVAIYNSANTMVRGLVDADVTAGQNTAVWDCKDDTGTNVPNGVYTYKINAVNALGKEAKEVVGTIGISQSSKIIMDVSDSPDPFNPKKGVATIKFTLLKDAKVTIKFYNRIGMCFKTLLNSSPRKAGVNSVTWNGRGILNLPVFNNTYKYKITVTSGSTTDRAEGTITVRR